MFGEKGDGIVKDSVLKEDDTTIIDLIKEGRN
jgi:hypothetical protein